MSIRRIIREEIEKVMNPQSEVIDVSNDFGSAFGVVHYNRDNLNNWVEKEGVHPGFDKISDDELFPIGILKNINIDTEHREHGHGADLLNKFMIECSNCSYIVLIADLGEKQNKGFNLVDWYEENGFSIWGESSGNPVMINKVDEMNEISLSVGHNQGFKPGIERRFPTNDEGGYSLNLSASGGPHKFPQEDNF